MKRGHRMHQMKRWLLPHERKVFTCRNKTGFASRAEAIACQPSQMPYKCRECGRWHLASRVA